MAGQARPQATRSAVADAGTGPWLQVPPGRPRRGSYGQAHSSPVTRSNGFAALSWAAETETADVASTTEQAQQAQQARQAQQAKQA